MGRTYAGVLGLVAFATVTARAVISGGEIGVTLKTASVCLFLFAFIGFAAGSIAESTVTRSVEDEFEERLQASRSDSSTEAA